MSKLKDIKIRLTAQSTFELVAKALADAGYQDVTEDVDFKDATELYAYRVGFVLKTTAHTNGGDYFDRQGNEEAFLDPWLNQLVTAEYWTQPATAPKETITRSTPLPSRKEHRTQRMFALLRAMQEALADGKGIAAEWAEEFAQLNEENNQ